MSEEEADVEINAEEEDEGEDSNDDKIEYYDIKGEILEKLYFPTIDENEKGDNESFPDFYVPNIKPAKLQKNYAKLCFLENIIQPIILKTNSVTMEKEDMLKYVTETCNSVQKDYSNIEIPDLNNHLISEDLKIIFDALHTYHQQTINKLIREIQHISQFEEIYIHFHKLVKLLNLLREQTDKSQKFADEFVLASKKFSIEFNEVKPKEHLNLKKVFISNYLSRLMHSMGKNEEEEEDNNEEEDY